MDNTPGFVTAALFIAVIISDLMKRRSDAAKGHFFLGIVSFLLISYLHEEGHDLVAWGILSIPILLIIIGLIFSGEEERLEKPGEGHGGWPGGRPGNGHGHRCRCNTCIGGKDHPGKKKQPAGGSESNCPVPEKQEPAGGSESNCPVPGQMIPAKKTCTSCSKGGPI